MAQGQKLMTSGSIPKQMVFFALPILLGNLFQQLYNTVDSLIVGNFLGSQALAAVSSSGNIIFLMIGFFNGVAIGAGVVISRYFGAREIERMQNAIHTTVAFGLIVSFIMTLIGVFFTPTLLRWMGTPDSVMAASVTYFKRLCHNKQLINSHFYRGVSELPYKLLFAVIYTHLEFRYEMSHTITSHHVHHFHQTRIPDGTLLDYMVQYRKPLFPQFFLYPKKFLPENNPHHKEFHLRPYIQNNANQ